MRKHPLLSLFLLKNISTLMKSTEDSWGVASGLCDLDGLLVSASPGFRGTVGSRVPKLWVSVTRPVPHPSFPYSVVMEKFERGHGEGIAEMICASLAQSIALLAIHENESQRLSEELVDRYQELHLLHDLMRDLSLTIGEQDISKVITQKALHSFDAELSAVVLGGDAGKPIYISHVETAPGMEKERSDTFLLSIAGETYLTLQPVVYEHLESFLIRFATPVDERLAHKPILSVPVLSDNKPIGALICVGRKNDIPYRTTERLLLTTMASYCGAALTRSRFFAERERSEVLRREIELARSLQQSLLTDSLIETSAISFSAACLPSAEVGGDLYFTAPLIHQRWAFVVADVSGHGLAAAFTMSSLRSILRSEFRYQTSPSSILFNANSILCQDLGESGMHATLFIAIYSERDRTLTYSGAGHHPAIVVHRNRARSAWLSSGGPAAGLFPDAEFEEHSITMESGDLLAIYSDGIVEARDENGSQFGAEKLHASVIRHGNSAGPMILKGVLDDVRRFQADQKQKDDMTISIIKIS